VSRWRVSCTIVAGLSASLALAACGGGTRQDAAEPQANFPVTVVKQSFPPSQTLSQHTHMVLVVRNTGSKPIPDLAVTVCNTTCSFRPGLPSGEGTSAQPFASNITEQGAGNPSRPTWVVDRPPGTCTGVTGYSCANGGPGADVTSNANTWALGVPLKPGHTATFDWTLTAVSMGQHTVAWQLAAGLAGKAKAVLADGSIPHGAFTVSVSAKPAQQYVNNAGQIVSGSR
jgi:hypothetical protein